MAQVIFADSGLLVDQGETVETYSAIKQYQNPQYEIINCDFEFSDDYKMFAWIYFFDADLFFSSNNELPSILQAAKSIIPVGQWDEVEDCIHEIGGFDAANKLRGKSFLRRLEKARQGGKINDSNKGKLDSLFSKFSNK